MQKVCNKKKIVLLKGVKNFFVAFFFFLHSKSYLTIRLKISAHLHWTHASIYSMEWLAVLTLKNCLNVFFFFGKFFFLLYNTNASYLPMLYVFKVKKQKQNRLWDMTQHRQWVINMYLFFVFLLNAATLEIKMVRCSVLNCGRFFLLFISILVLFCFIYSSLWTEKIF